MIILFKKYVIPLCDSVVFLAKGEFGTSAPLPDPHTASMMIRSVNHLARIQDRGRGSLALRVDWNFVLMHSLFLSVFSHSATSTDGIM